MKNIIWSIIPITALSFQMVSAGALNFDPAKSAPAPVIDTGWTYDQADAPFADTEDSSFPVGPYAYNLTSPATFRITDAYLAGDVWFVFDNGSLVLTSTSNGAQSALSPIGDPTGQAAWESATYTHGEVALSAGPHSITVQTDAVGGIPSGVFTRIDPSVRVPDGGSTGLLLGLALLALRRFARTPIMAES